MKRLGKDAVKLPKMNRNVVAAGVIAIIITVTIIGLEWRTTTFVDTLFGQLQNELSSEQWDAAGITMGALHAEWQERKVWLSFNGSRNALQDFDRQLARLRAAIELQDKPLAATTVAELTRMWSNFAG